MKGAGSIRFIALTVNKTSAHLIPPNTSTEENIGQFPDSTKMKPNYVPLMRKHQACSNRGKDRGAWGEGAGEK